MKKSDLSVMKLNKKIFRIVFFILTVFLLQSGIRGQSRIPYANKEIFLNGMNVAWVNFASDLGPRSIDTVKFRTIFDTVHIFGGNAMRLWLNTNGSQTPAFNGSGMVTGPGTNAIQDLKTILNIAHRYSIGLQLCLWSHDMLNKSELNSTELNRNAKFLTDTAYTMAYIRNALIPMVEAVKGNPALIGWEVFNEPEGITNEYGWGTTQHVPIADIQRVINLVAGAIHRTDPAALVTSGANSIQTLTDIQVPAKISVQEQISSMSQAQKDSLASGFNIFHRTDLTTQQVMDYMLKVAAAGNYNYYRDDRLIAAGGDPEGTLDYYNVHFYGTQAQSPFNHPYYTWQLSKPLVVGEFFMQDTYGVPYQKLYEQLYITGYAGAMSWQWWGDTQSNDNAKNQNHVRTLQSLKYMFDHYRNDIIVFPKTGTIYSFEVNPAVIQSGDTAVVSWDTEDGSTVTLDGKSVNVRGSKNVSPAHDTSYTLITAGEVNDTSTVRLQVLPSGEIMSFKAVPDIVGTGESTSLVWQAVKGSDVSLNGKTVPVSDSIIVYPDSLHNTYTLIARGEIKDSSTVTVTVLAADQVDRALNAGIKVSSNDSLSNKYSRPKNLVDGNNSTGWQAAKGNSQWIQIDMGKLIKINKITVRWGNNGFAGTYNIQLSADLINWQLLTAVFGGTGGTNNVETLDNLDGTGRYVEFLLQTLGTNVSAFSINEIEIYGVPESTGVVDKGSNLPLSYSLSQNYPNPFNPSTEIRYSIPNATKVILIVYNLLGQKVATLVDAERSPGTYEIKFDSHQLSSGIYFYTLRAGSFLKTKKMILLK